MNTESIKYKIQFYTYWHASSGLTAGANADTTVIKDENYLPYIPGKTLKGLIREMAELLYGEKSDFVKDCFGKGSVNKDGEETEDAQKSQCYFSNAELTETTKTALKGKDKNLLYNKVTSTTINKDGIAVDKSLREIEVTVPITLYAEIDKLTENYKEKMISSMKMIKRLGLNRNRGLGKCDFCEIEEEK